MCTVYLSLDQPKTKRTEKSKIPKFHPIPIFGLGAFTHKVVAIIESGKPEILRAKLDQETNAVHRAVTASHWKTPC